MGAVEHDCRSIGITAIENSHGGGNLVSQKVGTKTGMMFNPNDIVIARNSRGNTFGAAGTPATIGTRKLLDKNFAGKGLFTVLSHSGNP